MSASPRRAGVICAFAVLGLATGNRAPTPGTPALSLAAPLRFEANTGQWDGQIRFLARGRGHGLYLTDAGATLALLRPGQDGRLQAPGSRLQPDGRNQNGASPQVAQAAVTLRLVGARAVAPTGTEPLPGTTSHFVGRDPGRWRTAVGGFAKVRYARVLPGVDMVFYGAGEGQLEYDLILDPGVEPAQLGLAFDGARVTLEATGSALLQLPGGFQVRQPPPIAYQQDDRGGRVLVAAQFTRRADQSLGFVVPEYDRTRALVIDPKLVYATYLGGGSNDAAYGVATDSAGNAYVTGYTFSANFPIVGTSLPHGGVVDLFITKLNPAGTAPVYSTYLGGSGDETGLGIAVDSAGSAYVTGYTTSADFPVVSAVQASRAGAADAFVVKLNPAGTALTYSTYLGGPADDFGQAIAVDAAGRAHVTGQTESSTFPRSAPLQGTFGGEHDAFVSKLSAAGNSLIYSTYLGGSYDDFGQGIAVDAAGNAYVGGYTFSTDFPTQAALQPTGAASFYPDAFVSKLNPAGSALVYSTYLGGSDNDQAYGLALDAAGSVTIAGYTSSTNFPTVAPFQASYGGGVNDGFVSKLNPAGSALILSSYLGRGGNDLVYAVVHDGSGRIHLTGYTTSADFPTTAQAPQLSPGGGYDGFLTSVEAGVPTFSTFLGGAGTDFGLALAASGSSLLVVGQTGSSNFPVQSAWQSASGGASDAFVARVAFESAVPASDGATAFGLGLALAAAGVLAVRRRRSALR